MYLSTDYRAQSIIERMRERRAAYQPPQALKPGWTVGADAYGEPARIPYSALEQTSVNLIGPPGFGKSFLEFSLAVQTIQAGHGCIVIDPDGTVSGLLTHFLFNQGIDPDRILLIKPNHPDFVPKLCPLEFGIDPAASALLMVAGDVDFDHTPRLRWILRASCDALREQGLPMSALSWFLGLNPVSRQMRNAAIEQVTNPGHLLTWSDVSSIRSDRELREILDSCRNRCAAFAGEPRMCQMLTFGSGNIDWNRVLRAKQIVIVDPGQSQIGPPLSREDMTLQLGLVANSIKSAAFQQPENSGRHTFVFGDETHIWADDNLAESLALHRKRGVHWVLAHQTIDQLREKSKTLWSAISNCCQIKIVFGGLGREDAEYMAMEVFTGQVDGMRIKHRHYTRSSRPHMEWVDVRGRSVGGSETFGTAESLSLGDSQGESLGTSLSQSSSSNWLYSVEGGVLPITPDAYSTSLARQSGSNASRSRSRSRTESHTSSQSTASSWSDSIMRVPFTGHTEFLQDPALTFYSLEEVWEEKIAKLKNLPPRALVLKVYNQPAQIVSTLDVVASHATPEVIAGYERMLMERSPYIERREVAAQTFIELLSSCGFQYNNPVTPPDQVGEQCILRQTKTVTEAIVRRDQVADEAEIIDADFVVAKTKTPTTKSLAGPWRALPNFKEPETTGAPRRKRRGPASS